MEYACPFVLILPLVLLIRLCVGGLSNRDIKTRRKVAEAAIDREDWAGNPRPALPRTRPRLVLSISLYVVACVVPAFAGEEKVGTLPGIWLLVWGWIVLLSPWGLAWLANLPLFVGWLLLMSGRPKAAVAWGVVALVLSVGTWLPPLGPPHVGYFAWIGSMLVLVGAGRFDTVAQPSRHRELQVNTNAGDGA